MGSKIVTGLTVLKGADGVEEVMSVEAVDKETGVFG